MHEAHNNLEAHMFICTHHKDDSKGSCGQKGGKKLRSELKELAHDLGDHIKITESGCLGKCKHGIAAVIYPEGLELTELQSGQAMEIFEMLKHLYMDEDEDELE